MKKTLSVQKKLNRISSQGKDINDSNKRKVCTIGLSVYAVCNLSSVPVSRIYHTSEVLMNVYKNYLSNLLSAVSFHISGSYIFCSFLSCFWYINLSISGLGAPLFHPQKREERYRLCMMMVSIIRLHNYIPVVNHSNIRQRLAWGIWAVWVSAIHQGMPASLSSPSLPSLVLPASLFLVHYFLIN